MSLTTITRYGMRLAVTACRDATRDPRSAWAYPDFLPCPITMSSAQIDSGDGYPQRSRSAMPRPWRGEIPSESSSALSVTTSQVASI